MVSCTIPLTWRYIAGVVIGKLCCLNILSLAVEVTSGVSDGACCTALYRN